MWSSQTGRVCECLQSTPTRWVMPCIFHQPHSCDIFLCHSHDDFIGHLLRSCFCSETPLITTVLQCSPHHPDFTYCLLLHFLPGDNALSLGTKAMLSHLEPRLFSLAWSQGYSHLLGGMAIFTYLEPRLFSLAWSQSYSHLLGGMAILTYLEPRLFSLAWSQGYSHLLGGMAILTYLEPRLFSIAWSQGYSHLLGGMAILTYLEPRLFSLAWRHGYSHLLGAKAILNCLEPRLCFQTPVNSRIHHHTNKQSGSNRCNSKYVALE